MKRLILPFSLLAGAMDTATGLLLVISPKWTLSLLGIVEPEPAALVYLGWIGVFVACTGLSYALCLRGAAAAETVWTFTAVVRCGVALFLIRKLATGELPAAWLTVAIVDAMVAMVQWTGLRARWWRLREP